MRAGDATPASWQDAHRLATVVTAHARRDLQVASDSPRVDITAAVRRAGVALMWQPLPTVFGAYVNEPAGRPGLLVNSALPVAARRYTTAHELGHHLLQHASSVDDERTVGVLDEVPGGRAGRRWTWQEKSAEAFATWFLMPPSTVRSALQVLGAPRPGSALDCYRLALLMGVPYRTTVLHLPNLRLASTRQVAEWARVPPSRLKALLDRGVPAPERRDPDVWLLDAGFAGLDLELQPGDRLVVPDADAADLDAPDWLHDIGRTARIRSYSPSSSVAVRPGVVLQVADHQIEPQLLTMNADRGSWSINVACPPRPRGIDQGSRW